MAHSTRLIDLVARWQELREHGQAITPEQLCHDDPELLEELKKQVEALSSLAAFLNTSGGPVPSVNERPTLPPAEVPALMARGENSSQVETIDGPADRQAVSPFPTIPGYEILGELGRGGMGVVYKARHQTLKRLVALKMILAGAHAGEHELARFRMEAEAVARLKHPSIVQIFEIGEHAGLPYFCLELCDGGSLATRVDGMPPKEAGRIVESLARAMAAAHDSGIIHRDLKPANVLLDNSIPKITDFGLAKKLDEAGQTASGAVMGTPSYMAPEQAAGMGQYIGPAVDIYALGAILYECVTGHPPFKAASAYDIILKVLSEEPVPPGKLNATVPRDLETICLKCLRKEAHLRYASAAELADDLRRFSSNEPIQARPVSRWERAIKWVKRHPARTAALGLALVALILGVGGGSAAWLWQNSEAARRELKKAELRAEWLIYAHQISLAQFEWQIGNVEESWDHLNACRQDFRGWEHDYLYTQFNSNQQTLRGHTHDVLSAAFSPDGKRIVSGSTDKTLKVWDAHSGEETMTLKGHASNVLSVAFSPDGKRIVSGSYDTVKVWDAQSGQETLGLKERNVSCLAFSPDGKCIVGGSTDTQLVKVWDAESGQRVMTLKGHTWSVLHVAFSQDGKRIVSGSKHNMLKIWDAQSGSGQETMMLKGQTKEVLCMAFSPDRRRIASSFVDKTLTVWDARTGQETAVLRGHTSSIPSVAFSPDGNRIASGSADKTLKVWDAQNGQETTTLKGHASEVLSVAFSHDGKRIVSGSHDKTLKIWDFQRAQENPILKGHTNAVTSVAFSPDGKRIVSGSADNTLKVWDATSGQETMTLKGHTRKVMNVAFSPDGKRIVSASHDMTLKVWNSQSGQETQTIKVHDIRGTSVAFSPDSKSIVSGLDVWDPETGQNTLNLKGDGSAIMSISFSPDGKSIVSGSADNTLKVWDATSGQETLPLNGHTDRVMSVAFSPDSKHIVSGSWDKTLKVWDAASGQEIMTFNGHTGGVNSVAFSPDGNRIVSAGADKTLRVWDTASGQETLTLKWHTDLVNSVAFGPDGKRIVSGSADGTIKIWDGSVRARGRRREEPDSVAQPGARVSGPDRQVTERERQLLKLRTGRCAVVRPHHERDVRTDVKNLRPLPAI